MEKIKIKRFRYILDWYQVDEIEFDLKVTPRFKLELRNSSWYITPYEKGDSGFLEENYHKSFQLAEPGDAIRKLSDKIAHFSTNNNCGFTKDLKKLLENIK